MSRIRNETKNIIKILEAYDFSDEGIEKALLETCISEENESWKKKVAGILSYICHDLIQRLWKTAEEMDHIMDGLSSRYILPELSGSPHTGGVNLYQADVISSAWIRGRFLQKQHGSLVKDWVIRSLSSILPMKENILKI